MDHIKKALLDHGYKAKLTAGNLILRRKGASDLIFICTAIAIPIIWISTFAHFTVFLLGIGMLLAPWIYRRWQFPPEIRFLQKEGIFLNRGPLAPQHRIQYADINELQLERTVKPADVSPFMEGNEEYVYNFVAATDDERHRLLRLEYRQDNPEEVEKIRNFLLQFLRHLKAEN